MNMASSDEATSVRASRAERAAAEVLARLGDGRWPVGTKIPVEAELVEMLGVGRNTVREAVATLVHDGYLSREQGRGTFVVRTEIDEADGAAALVSRATRRDALQLRTALDVEAVRIAARTAGPHDVALLRELLEARASAWRTGGTDERVAADTALHRAIIGLTGNALFVELYDGLLTLFEAVLVDDVQGDVDSHAAHHHDMVEAIAAGDAEAAASHLERLLLPLRREVGEA